MADPVKISFPASYSLSDKKHPKPVTTSDAKFIRIVCIRDAASISVQKEFSAGLVA